MARLEYTLNADEPTPWVEVTGPDGVKISGAYNSGTGTHNIEERIAGTNEPVYDADGVAVTYTASYSNRFKFVEGDVIRVRASGTSSLDSTVKFTGPVIATNLS